MTEDEPQSPDVIIFLGQFTTLGLKTLADATYFVRMAL
jgi:hypothetical protein